ncbi:hypothetical protein [Nostoc sp. C117]|uniref:hypothetical protein n=1 Tax=Nostoc sp. C117 TaxID=3349875 RepID=UPI00370DB181
MKKELFHENAGFGFRTYAAMFHEHPDYLAQQFPRIELEQGFTHLQTASILDCENNVSETYSETIKTFKISVKIPLNIFLLTLVYHVKMCVLQELKLIWLYYK